MQTYFYNYIQIEQSQVGLPNPEPNVPIYKIVLNQTTHVIQATSSPARSNRPFRKAKGTRSEANAGDARPQMP